VRVRAGQTLILTGMISEADRQLFRKWPILGDMPLTGQLFHASRGDHQRNELATMVTPHSINDASGSTYGLLRLSPFNGGNSDSDCKSESELRILTESAS